MKKVVSSKTRKGGAHMDVTIGILAHYSGMKKQYQELENKLGCKLVFRMGVMELAIEPAIDLVEKYHVQAIIANVRTSEIIRQFVSVPVIPLEMTNFSIISAIYKAELIDAKIAFADIRKNDPLYDFELVKNILNLNARQYLFDDINETESVLKSIIMDGYDTILTTAGCMIAKAKEYGIRSFMADAEEHDLINAIKSAQMIIYAKQEAEEKSRWLRAVLDTSDEGLLTLDNERKIKMANSVAEMILGKSEHVLADSDISSLSQTVPYIERLLNLTDQDVEIFDGNDNKVVMSRHEVLDRSANHIGTLIKMQKLKKIQQIEMQARKKASSTGFIAQYTFSDVLGHSQAIQKAKETALKYAKTSSSILIYGESGTGKEVFAQSIHNASKCADGPFVAINCATFPEPLLESELFGYEEGAFTGAKKGGKVGLLEMAHGGTLFLDEIGEMPIQLQSRLLRVLQEKVIRRIGGIKNIPIDVRFISASNRLLTDEIKEKRFREDLFFRINVLNLNIPPLRERKGDIEDLVKKFISDNAEKQGTYINISPACIELMKEYDWKGNVRELNNFVERLCVLSNNNTIEPSNLQIELRRLQESASLKSAYMQASADDSNAIYVPIGSLRFMEDNIIDNLLKRYDGDRQMLGSILGISATTLWRRLKEKNL